MNWLLDGDVWGFWSLSGSVLRLPLRSAVDRGTGTFPQIWELLLVSVSSPFDFPPSKTNFSCWLWALNSFTSGSYILIDKCAFSYGQIILYLEKIFLLCVLFHWTLSMLNVVWMHREELMIGRYRVGKLFILAPRKLKSWVKD